MSDITREDLREKFHEMFYEIERLKVRHLEREGELEEVIESQAAEIALLKKIELQHNHCPQLEDEREAMEAELAALKCKTRLNAWGWLICTGFYEQVIPDGTMDADFEPEYRQPTPDTPPEWDHGSCHKGDCGSWVRVAVIVAEQPEHFRCRTCGPHMKADQDGCCARCGRDCAVEACACPSPAAAGEVGEEPGFQEIAGAAHAWNRSRGFEVCTDAEWRGFEAGYRAAQRGRVMWEAVEEYDSPENVERTRILYAESKAMEAAHFTMRRVRVIVAGEEG